MVLLWEKNKSSSIRGIAKEAKLPLSYCQRWVRRYRETGTVEDAPRLGRPRILDDAMLCTAEAIGAEKCTGTSRRVAATLLSEYGTRVSPRTVRRNFSHAGLVWEGPKQSPLLTKLHKTRRLQWAQKHLRNKTSFSGWMFTDSKIFLISRTKGKAPVRCWHPRGKKPIELVGKTSVGIHVYMGVTKHGVTKPIVVTGAGNRIAKYFDQKGKLRPGMCAEEYVERVVPRLIQYGNELVHTC